MQKYLIEFTDIFGHVDYPSGNGYSREIQNATWLNKYEVDRLIYYYRGSGWKLRVIKVQNYEE